MLSIPNISLIILNPVFPQKRQEFLFIVELVMVFFLTADIVHHLRHVGLAHAECPIPELPGKSGTSRPLLMHPDD
jgi:hypothetical protein